MMLHLVDLVSKTWQDRFCISHNNTHQRSQGWKPVSELHVLFVVRRMENYIELLCHILGAGI
jgi:hypothetical protein